jgi:hypothetical protein
VVIDHILKPDQAEGMAKRLSIAGLSVAPRVMLNGKLVAVSGAAPEFQVPLSS